MVVFNGPPWVTCLMGPSLNIIVEESVQEFVRHALRKGRKVVLEGLGESFIRKWFWINPKERIKSCDHLHSSTCFMTTEFSTPCCSGVVYHRARPLFERDYCFLAAVRWAVCSAPWVLPCQRHLRWNLRNWKKGKLPSFKDDLFLMFVTAMEMCPVQKSRSPSVLPVLWARLLEIEMPCALQDVSQHLWLYPSLPVVSTKHPSK